MHVNLLGHQYQREILTVKADPPVYTRDTVVTIYLNTLITNRCSDLFLSQTEIICSTKPFALVKNVTTKKKNHLFLVVLSSVMELGTDEVWDGFWTDPPLPNPPLS